MNLTQEFNKLVGAQVKVNVKIKEIGGHKFSEPTLDKNCETMQRIFDLAAKSGYKVNVTLPGEGGTMDMRPPSKKVAVDIEKDSQNKYRIMSLEVYH